MAHERLSPRQRMIGMMYLILTAMLALNVSKEAVEAFKRVDKSLTITLANYTKKNNLIYSEFDRAAAENPLKAGKFKTLAYDLKTRADEVYDYIQGLKIEIITTAEGKKTKAVQGNEVNIDEVKKPTYLHRYLSAPMREGKQQLLSSLFQITVSSSLQLSTARIRQPKKQYAKV